MSTLYGVYGEVKFPKGATAKWRAAVLTETPDLPPSIQAGHAFDHTTVADVIAEAQSFGAREQQVFDLTVEGDVVRVQALFVDEIFWDHVRSVAAAFVAAAALGAKGTVCFSEITGHPSVLVLDGKKHAFQRKAPPGDDEAQEALIAHCQSRNAAEKAAKKKKRNG